MIKTKIIATISQKDIVNEIVEETSFTPEYMGSLEVSGTLGQLSTTSTGDIIVIENDNGEENIIDGQNISPSLLKDIEKVLKESEINVKAEKPVRVYGPNLRAKNNNGQYVALYAGSESDNREFLAKGVKAELQGGENNG